MPSIPLSFGNFFSRYTYTPFCNFFSSDLLTAAFKMLQLILFNSVWQLYVFSVQRSREYASRERHTNDLSPFSLSLSPFPSLSPFFPDILFCWNLTAASVADSICYVYVFDLRGLSHCLLAPRRGDVHPFSSFTAELSAWRRITRQRKRTKILIVRRSGAAANAKESS